MTHRVLVTGGCGFIGSNLVPQLVESGHSVRVLDNLSTGRREYLEGVDVELVEGDIRDVDTDARAVDGIDIVVHLAAAGSVVDSVADPWTNFQMNAEGSFKVLDAARHAGVTRAVFASTGGALIGEAKPPVDESSLPKPISPYGASKLVAEAYCQAFAHSYGLSTLALRFANVYGPFSGHKRGAITRFFRCLHEGRPIVIYGDGQATRDFIHVRDLCAGIESGLSADLPTASVVHLATDVETSVAQLAQACCQVAGKPNHPITFEPPRAGEVTRNFATYDLAAELLDFQPSVSLLDGLASTWKWFVDYVF